MKEVIEKQEEATSGRCSRRALVKGSAALLLAGGVAGRLSNALAATPPEPTYAPAPELPWKWTPLDPMEAGTRAYHAYLKNRG